MKSIILVAFAVVALAAAVPVQNAEPSKIISSDVDIQPNGEYKFNVDTENKIHREEEGIIREGVDADNKPIKFLTVRGTYSYTNPDGLEETINYYADENGFHAEGPSVPKVAV